ncbi:hypothetical protein VNO78_06084 [Psophocarpus tetragonolobus]|uniref:PGG domain-containing protein n=1 Tax=Psophocarpus tetragonolobus TaxID=3891 RepID=A0AAN9SRV8_PSOTE
MNSNAGWKERCNKMMEELKKQFPCEDAASEARLVHKKLVGEKTAMSCELYKAVENGNVENLVDVLKQECKERKLGVCDIFDKVTGAGDSLLHVASYMGKEEIAELILKLILSRHRKITREKNELGNTPLHEAVNGGDLGVLEDILHADESVVHDLNKSKQSPLYLAVVSGIRKFLIFYWKFHFQPINRFHSATETLHSMQPYRKGILLIRIIRILVVGTLIVTVTFAAAFTMPGGLYSSDDPNIKNRGMAVLTHKPLFWKFTIVNTIALYSSVMACGLMLTARVLDYNLAIKATFIATACLGVAFLIVPLAFLTALLTSGCG